MISFTTLPWTPRLQGSGYIHGGPLATRVLPESPADDLFCRVVPGWPVTPKRQDGAPKCVLHCVALRCHPTRHLGNPSQRMATKSNPSQRIRHGGVLDRGRTRSVFAVASRMGGSTRLTRRHCPPAKPQNA